MSPRSSFRARFMRHGVAAIALITSLCLIATVIIAGTPQLPGVSVAQSPKAPRPVSVATLPLVFEANQGQTDNSVKFVARGSGYTLFLGPDLLTLALAEREAGPPRLSAGYHGARPRHAETVRIRFTGTNRGARISGAEELPGTANYFIGNDRSKFVAGVRTFRRVKCEEIYPGVDLVYYGSQGRLEHDLVVAPGASYKAIALRVEGARRLESDGEGGIALQLAGGHLRLQRPLVYQDIEGRRQLVAGRYSVRAGNQIAFELGAYDNRRPVVIDPILSYSTYIGGSSTDTAWAIAMDSAGNVYVAGRTTSIDFPTASPLQAARGGNTDVFVMKLNASGTPLYATYLGGSAEDSVSTSAIAVDRDGNAYITGWTLSSNYPVTQGASQPAFGGGSADAFVTKLNATGNALVYSTYLGGKNVDQGLGIAVDSSGAAYVAGGSNSTEFPTTAGALNTKYGGGSCGPYNAKFSCPDAFVTKLSASGSVVYSTFLGSDNDDTAYGIAVDSAGNAYVAGAAASAQFPVTAGALQAAYGGGSCVQVILGGGGSITVYFDNCKDAFVSKLNASGSALIYSTFLGGGGEDDAADIAVDAAGNAYVVGWTQSATFPTTPGAFQTFYAGTSSRSDGFVSKLSPDGSRLIYSTFLGGSGSDEAHAIVLDASGVAYITGITSSSNFPSRNPLQTAYGGGAYDGFIAVVNDSGSDVLFSSVLGGTGDDRTYGIALHSSGSIFLAGLSESANFPTVSGALQAALKGASDAILVRIDPGTAEPFNPVPTIASVLPASAIAGQGGTTLTVEGTGFLAGIVLRWNGSDRQTAFFSNTLLQAMLPAADVAAAGSAQITLFNLAPRGGASAAKSFSIVTRPNTGGLVNAAHYGARISAGGIISIFGTNLASSTQAASSLPLPTTLGNTKVTIGAYDMPLFYVSPTQINAQVPFELFSWGALSTAFTVTVAGKAQTAVTVSISPTAPGIFTATQDGKGAGAIIGPRGAVSASNPAKAGDDIAIFVTGLGSVSPAVKSGEAAPSSPLSKVSATTSVSIGGMPASVSYAGLAPGFVGLYQVNAKIPAGVPTGNAVPLVLKADSEAANVVTIAVQ